MQKYFISFISNVERRNGLLILVFNFYEKKLNTKTTLIQINIGLLTIVLTIQDLEKTLNK